MLRSIGLSANSQGIRGVGPEEEKEGYGAKDLQKKEGFMPGMKMSEGVMQGRLRHINDGANAP